MTIQRTLAAGAATAPSASSSATSAQAPSAPKKALAKAANSDAVVASRSFFKRAIETVAMERARAAVARGDATPAQAGMVAAMGSTGGVGFAPSTISRIREGEAPQQIVETDPKVVTWTMENRVRSGDKTMEQVIPGQVFVTPEGLKFKLLHVSGEHAITTVQGHQPFADKPNIPSDAFVQSQTVQAFGAFLTKLESLKLDLGSIYKDKSDFSGVIRMFVNAGDILNAAFVPQKNIYFFGNHKNVFPLAADKDTVIHEGSHGLLEHIVPGLVRGSGEGGAWHEAFGDLMACLFHKNPGLGEDLGTFLAQSGQGGQELKGGIRRVDNKQPLDPAVEEVHDRSLAYSGLLWSTAGKLAKMLGDTDKAADLMLGAIIKANFFLVTTKPSSSDLVQAVAHGMRSHFAKNAPEVGDAIIKEMIVEAKEREMLNMPLTTAVKPKAEAADGAAVVKLLKSHPELATRKDIDFEILADRVFDNVRKVMVRPVLVSNDGKTRLPVDGANLTAVIEDGKIFSMDTAAIAMPPKFDLEGGLPDIALGIEAGKKIIYDHLVEAAMQGSEGAAQMLEAFDTLFGEGNVQAEWVISRNTIAISLSTLAGDFIVDPKSRKVWPRGTLQFEPLHRREAC